MPIGAGTIASWFARWDLPQWAAMLARMFVAAVAVIVLVLIAVLMLVWLERKVSADIQSRMGPARVGGRFGLLQTVADAIKLLLKEDIIPAQGDRWLFLAAPAIVFLPAYMAMVTVPFSGRLAATDLRVGLVYIIAVLSLPSIGLIMAGWSSNNKYSLLGGIRAVGQLVTYEVPFVISMLCVVIFAGSLSIADIVRAQSNYRWFIFSPPLTLAFIIFLAGAIAETNRIPFDLPEAESELVAGYHTEYSGLRFAMFFLGEYAMLFFVCALGTLLFLGGWHGPWLPGEIWFLGKTFALIILMMWVRWTYPRLRIDQLMHFGWKFLLPVALLDLVLTAGWALIRGGPK